MSKNTGNPTPPELRNVDRHVRRAIVCELPDSLRQIRRVVLTETMANGVPVSASALSIVLAAHLDLASGPLTFTAAHVQELLWFGVSEFCEDFGYEMPVGCPEALHAVLSVVCRVGSLDDGSDSMSDLFGAFRQLQAS